jgi:hypothetical protein
MLSRHGGGTGMDRDGRRRALPPVESSTLTIANYDVDAEARVHALMFEQPDHAALVRFNVCSVDISRSLPTCHTAVHGTSRRTESPN